MPRQPNHHVIRNSNWTEWSTIQGVIARVISKSKDSWIVRYEVQLLINRIDNKISEFKMSFENLFWTKTSVVLFLSFENCAKIAKVAIKAGVIDVRIMWESNYKYPITKSSNWIPVIGHPLDRAQITWQIGPWRTNHDREFCYRYVNNGNWTEWIAI